MQTPAEVFYGASQEGYVGPGQMEPCPYEFTGNASDEWAEFFTLAYAFGLWASTEDVSGCGPSFRMEIHGYPDGGFPAGTVTEEWDSRKRILPNANPREKYCADGITLYLTEEGWASDVFMHFTELLSQLPTGYPDGDLEIHVGKLGDDRVVLHLWHD